MMRLFEVRNLSAGVIMTSHSACLTKCTPLKACPCIQGIGMSMGIGLCTLPTQCTY